MSIPTLDLRLAENVRSEAAKQLVAALEEPGFLYLKNVKGYPTGKTSTANCATYRALTTFLRIRRDPNADFAWKRVGMRISCSICVNASLRLDYCVYLGTWSGSEKRHEHRV